MNKTVLLGRLTSDPDVRYTTGEKTMAIARYTLAVDRKYKRDGEPTADFIRCVAFDRAGEFAEKYFKKGTKICVSGRIQTGSYQNKDGQTVYTTDVVIEDQEFAESKAVSDANRKQAEPKPEPKEAQPSENDGFMNIPDNIDDSGLPFNF